MEVLSVESAELMRRAITEAGGNEVFFVGRPDKAHLVAEVPITHT